MFRRGIIKKAARGLSPHTFDIRPEVWKKVRQELTEAFGSERKLKKQASKPNPADLRLRVFALIRIHGQPEVLDVSRQVPAAFCVDGEEKLRISP